MLLGIDHLAIAVGDLDEAAAALERAVGLAVTGGGRHPTLGTENRLAWLGDSYLELVSIADRDVAQRSWLGMPTLAALETGGGLATWAIATDSIESDVAVLRGQGARFGEVIPGERLRPDGRTVRWRLAIPEQPGRDQPFLIQHDLSSAEWTPDERAARAGENHPIGGPVRLEVLELPVASVTAAIQRLSRTADLRFRPSLAGGAARDANLGRHVVRLSPGRDVAARPGVGLSCPAGDSRSVDLLACRWVVRKSA